MKFIGILITSLLLTANSYGLAAWDLRLMQRDPTNVSNIARDLPLPSTHAVVGLDFSTSLPRYFTLGSTLSFNTSTGAMDVNSISTSKVTGLSTVATSGAYSDLTGKPSIPAAQQTTDWSATTGITQILNKPSFSNVATSGDYNDLANLPSLSAAQVNSDWTAVSGLSQILNKPSFSTVAVSGAYSDLSGKPSLASVSTSGAYSDLSGKPSLAAVATSGDYSDLSSKPSIPAGQVNSDWSSASGLSQILNKPSLATVATSGAYSDLSGKPSLSTVATSGSYSDLSGKPMLATVATSGSYTDLSSKPTIPAAQIQSDWTQVTNTSLDYIKNKPSLSAVATSGAYSDLSGKPTIPNGVKAYEGTTSRADAFSIFKSSTVASGVAVFQLTFDGLSTGTALFPNGVISDSVNPIVNDSTASFQMSWAFSNSNKTLTITANKLTTANILTGLLGQAAANGSVVKLSVWGY